MDIWDYFFRFQYEVRRRCGVDPEYERYSADRGSERGGALEVIVPLTADAYLRLHERVEIVDDRWPRRTDYSDVLIAGGHHLHAWELDPSHPEMPLHEHLGPERRRRAGAEMSLKQVLAASWDLLGRRG